ncbi:MAG: alpha-amylase, partial [Pseudomonadota bacterium]
MSRHSNPKSSYGRLLGLLAALLAAALAGCADQAPPLDASALAATDVAAPPAAEVTPAPTIDEDFLSRAAIYEVNVRQFSEAGTLAEVTRQVPRLKALGVDILWLMPIQPIGEAKRKGALGSYYAIQDYTAVHPD